MSLTSVQIRELKKLAHPLKPVVIVGQHGLSENVLSEIGSTLDIHELIKVKIQEGCLTDRRTVAADLAAETGSAIVQILGKTFLLYRPGDDPLITLP